MPRKITVKSQRYFATGISMITSTGPFGKNVMAAEWTMQVSYEPPLVAVFIHNDSISLKNIIKTREFGVNVASDQQTMLVNISGGYSKIELDKLKIKNSFKFLPSRYIKSPMIADCVINAECKLVKIQKIGDHNMVIGKMLSIQHDATKKPLIYHAGKYHKIGNAFESDRKHILTNKKIFDWFYMQSNGRFVLKCVGAIIKHKKKILTIKHKAKNMTVETIPYLVPRTKRDNKKMLISFLKKNKINAELEDIPILKRIMLYNKKGIQRINFVLFEGKFEKSNQMRWKNTMTVPIIKEIIN